MLAHIIGEVGTFCTVLLAVFSKKYVLIFIEIDSYLTNTAKDKLAQFFLRHGVVSYYMSTTDLLCAILVERLN